MTIDRIIELVLTVLAFVVVFYGRKNALKVMAVELMLTAEKLATQKIIDADGLTKMNMVIGELMMTIPVDIKSVLVVLASLTGKDLQQFTEDLVQMWYDAIVTG